MPLYHGTGMDKLHEIMKEGLIINAPRTRFTIAHRRICPQAICMTPEKKYAEFFALAGHWESGGVVLEIDGIKPEYSGKMFGEYGAEKRAYKNIPPENIKIEGYVTPIENSWTFTPRRFIYGLQQ